MAKYLRVTCVDRCHIFVALNSHILTTLHLLRESSQLFREEILRFAQEDDRNGLRKTTGMGSGRRQEWAQEDDRNGLRKTTGMGSGRRQEWAQEDDRNGLRKTIGLGSGRRQEWLAIIFS